MDERKEAWKAATPMVWVLETRHGNDLDHGFGVGCRSYLEVK